MPFQLFSLAKVFLKNLHIWWVLLQKNYIYDRDSRTPHSEENLEIFM